VFIPPASRHLAYENTPQPIGLEQTISQPLIIGLMTEALELTGDEKVLEIGTGSGYQTAILAELAHRVISTERLPALAETAKTVLDELGYTNIEIHLSGEILGYPPQSPYDAIIVTAAAPRIPEELLEQLKTGGHMVIPVGPRHTQELYKITKETQKNRIRNLGGCRFVPLIGPGGWEED